MTTRRGSTHPSHEALHRILAVKGAVASVSLSHPDVCDCDTCKAAHGDPVAFGRILAAFHTDDPAENLR